MKSTGIIRNTDNLGRIVLPKELRKSFGIGTDTPLEIFTEGNAIILRKYRPAAAAISAARSPPTPWSSAASTSARPAAGHQPAVTKNRHGATGKGGLPCGICLLRPSVSAAGCGQLPRCF